MHPAGPPPPSLVTKYASPARCSTTSIRAARRGPRVAYDKLTDGRLGESSEKVRARVDATREKQRLRFLNTGLTWNADMRPPDVRKFCQLDDASTSLMRTAMSPWQLSARGFHRVLKLARTIADLADSPSIQTAHLAEAIHQRAAEAAELTAQPRKLSGHSN